MGSVEPGSIRCYIRDAPAPFDCVHVSFVSADLFSRSFGVFSPLSPACKRSQKMVASVKLAYVAIMDVVADWKELNQVKCFVCAFRTFLYKLYLYVCSQTQAYLGGSHIQKKDI